jgi:SOS-response transcriptional repressor LexA
MPQPHSQADSLLAFEPTLSVPCEDDTICIPRTQGDTTRGVAETDTKRIIRTMARTWQERTKERMRDQGLTQDDLRETLEVRTRGAVGHYLSGRRTPTHEQLLRLSKKLGCSISYLLEGEDLLPNQSNVTPGPEIRAHVPLISWVQAGAWCGIIDNGHPGDGGVKPIPTTKNVGPNAFALRVHGDSMEPVFVEGSIIVVDPDQRAENGSYVVVRLEGEETATFKQLVQDGGRQYLKPLNPRYDIIRIDGDATICGVVRQMVMDFD